MKKMKRIEYLLMYKLNAFKENHMCVYIYIFFIYIIKNSICCDICITVVNFSIKYDNFFKKY